MVRVVTAVLSGCLAQGVRASGRDAAPPRDTFQHGLTAAGEACGKSSREHQCGGCCDGNQAGHAHLLSLRYGPASTSDESLVMRDGRAGTTDDHGNPVKSPP